METLANNRAFQRFAVRTAEAVEKPLKDVVGNAAQPGGVKATAQNMASTASTSGLNSLQKSLAEAAKFGNALKDVVAKDVEGITKRR